MTINLFHTEINGFQISMDCNKDGAFRVYIAEKHGDTIGNPFSLLTYYDKKQAKARYNYLIRKAKAGF